MDNFSKEDLSTCNDGKFEVITTRPNKLSDFVGIGMPITQEIVMTLTAKHVQITLSLSYEDFFVNAQHVRNIASCKDTFDSVTLLEDFNLLFDAKECLTLSKSNSHDSIRSRKFTKASEIFIVNPDLILSYLSIEFGVMARQNINLIRFIRDLLLFEDEVVILQELLLLDLLFVVQQAFSIQIGDIDLRSSKLDFISNFLLL